MTITSQVREATATGNGIATSFPYDFIIPDEAYAQVFTEVIATGVETELSPLLYTISGIGDPDGGAVEYPLVGSPLAATHRLIIRRTVEYIQEVDISTQSGFNASVVEAQLDLMVMMVQQLSQGSDTALAQTIEAAEDANDSQIAAALSEVDAAGSANNAAAQAVLAAASAAAASASAAAAVISASAADASAISAAASVAAVAAGMLGTSVTSQDPSTTGSKTWTTQAGKAWQIGQRLRVASDDGSKVQEGVVTAYTGTSLTILVDFNAGSAGAHTDWNISVTGERGPAGASGAGTGDVIGPASSVDSHVVLFNGAGGKTIKSSLTLFTDMATKVYADSAVATAITAIKNGVSASFDTLAELAAGLALKFDLAGGTITGDTTISKSAAAALLVESTGAAASVTVKASAGLNADIILNEAAVDAWYLRSDGSDNTFKLRAKRPSDSVMIVPMSVDRETGVAEFASGITSGGSSFLAQGSLITVFTANGTWTKDARAKFVRFKVLGAGGGGGGVVAVAGGSGAAGGAAGIYSEALYTAANAGASQAITIGALGAGGAAGNNNGTGGGDTSVGTLVVAPGGNGGQGANGAYRESRESTGNGSATGTFMNFFQRIDGGVGSAGAASSSTGSRGQHGEAGRGGAAGATSAGTAATGYGAGGGGGGTGATTNRAGGNGAPGLVLVEEYF